MSKSKVVFTQAPELQQEPAVITAATGNKRVMMYNIPFEITKDDIIEMVDAHGFAETYHSVHMPRTKFGKNSRKPQTGLSYGFITFKTVEIAAVFLRIFQNFHFLYCKSEKLTSTKPGQASPSAGRRRM